MTTMEALADLVSVTALEHVTPHRVQAWQQAAREVMAHAASDPPRLDTDHPSADGPVARSGQKRG